MRLHSCGFSLLEVMVAAAVLAIALLAFLGLMSSGTMISNVSRERSLAGYELQAAAEQTVTVKFDDFKTVYPDRGYLPAFDYRNPRNGSPGRPTPPSPLRLLPLNTQAIRVDYLPADPSNPTFVDPNSITYRLTIEYKDYKNQDRKESIVTRRTR